MNKQEEADKAKSRTQLVQLKITNEAPVETPETTRDSNRGYEGRYKGNDAKALKQQVSFIRLLEMDGHRVHASGKYTKCLCPFHDENTPSLVVGEGDDYAKCYGCGWYGDIYDYVMKCHDTDFKEAYRHIEKNLNKLKRKVSRERGDKPQREVHALTQGQRELHQSCAKALADDEKLCREIAESRRWKAETIKALAEEGVLGWLDGNLAFIYETGLKLRKWPDRDIYWRHGGTSIWRQHRIKDAQNIIVCEGETDAIALLNAGLEDDPTFAVVALPSATVIPSGIVELLRGKHVTLCMDNDEAGHMATAKLSDMLLPVCASVETLNFEEVA